MLTPAQKAIVKADILAKSDLNTIPMTWDGSKQIAELYNGPVVPDWIAWRTDVDPDEIMRNGMDWTRVDNLSVGKARIWDWLTKLGTFDASKANIRAGIDACWIGTAPDLAVRAMVYVHCKRSANRLEKLFSTGTGTDASPAILTFQGTTSMEEIMQIRG